MVRLPWRRGSGETTEGTREPEDAPEAEETGEPVAADDGPEPVVSCDFQDGTLSVYEDRVRIERPGRSRFDDTSIPAGEITGVEFSAGLTIGYLQIEREGVAGDTGGLLSDPVDEHTVHFGRGDRACAREARDAILERAGGSG